MLFEGLTVGIFVVGFSFCIKTCIELKGDMREMKAVLRLHLKKNGTTDEEIDIEILNHKKNNWR